MPVLNTSATLGNCTLPDFCLHIIITYNQDRHQTHDDLSWKNPLPSALGPRLVQCIPSISQLLPGVPHPQEQRRRPNDPRHHKSMRCATIRVHPGQMAPAK